MGAAPLAGRLTPVVIADRRDFDRLALELLCAQRTDVVVAASVATVTDAVQALAALRAGTVLVGHQLALVDGVESVRRLRAAGAARVVLVGTGEPERLRREALRIDADGVLQRDGDPVAQLGTLTAAA
jgi:DNA-binding NarL/FixJ family response regulator